MFWLVCHELVQIVNQSSSQAFVKYFPISTSGRLYDVVKYFLNITEQAFGIPLSVSVLPVPTSVVAVDVLHGCTGCHGSVTTKMEK